MIVRATLSKLGHTRRGCIAANGQEALAAVQAENYDLVLLDMQMPVMDGLEAARRIRALGGKFLGLPMVAVTANSFQSDREACLGAGMNDFVSKPFDQHQIDAIITRHVGTLRKVSLKPRNSVPEREAAPQRDLGPYKRLLEIAALSSVSDAREIVVLFGSESSTMLDRMIQLPGSAASHSRDVAECLCGPRPR